jgi:hypothetical protein
LMLASVKLGNKTSQICKFVIATICFNNQELIRTSGVNIMPL